VVNQPQILGKNGLKFAAEVDKEQGMLPSSLRIGQIYASVKLI
jgi:hypothetical protein